MNTQNSYPSHRPSETNARPHDHTTHISTHRSFSLSGRKESVNIENTEKPSRLVKILDWVILACFGALFFGLPVFFTGLTFQGLVFEKQIFFYSCVLIALVAWATKGVISGEVRIRRTPIDLPLLIFLFAYAIATFFSVDRWHSFWGFFGDPSRGLLNVIGLAIVYYVIASHYTTKRMIGMLWALTTSNLILSSWAFLQIMGVNMGKLASIVPSSSLGSLSILGNFSGMMLPILIMLILHITSKKVSLGASLIAKLSVLFFVLLLNIAILLVLYSFVSWLGILIGVSMFLVFILARIVRPSENWTWVPMVMFVAILAILMIGNNNLARVSLPIEVGPSYKLSWDVAKESLKESFLVGSGPASYGYSFSKFHSKDFNLESLYSLRFYQGTGMFFEAISTVGAIGTLSLILMVLTFIGAGMYMLATAKSKNKLHSLGLFSAAIMLVVNAFSVKVEGTFLAIGVLICALAIVTLLSESEPEDRFYSLSLKASPKYALALAFIFMVVSAGVVFLFVFIGKVFIADLKAGAAVREQEISEQGSISKIANAISWHAREGRYFTRLGQEYLVLANSEAVKPEKERDLNLIRGYLQSGIMFSKQGRDMMPKDALAQETLAQAYENAGFYISDSLVLAEEAYKKALELEPHNPIYMVKIGQIKIASGSANKSEQELKDAAQQSQEWFKKAIDEKPNFATAYYQLSFARELLADKDGSIEAIEKAVQYEPNNISYVFNLARLYQIRGNEDDKKIAEAIYKKIIEANGKEINAQFSLGLLYEKMKKTPEATAQYNKVISLLDPKEEEMKKQLQKMIDNLSKGIENTPENIKTDIPVPESTPQQPALIEGGQQ